MIRSFLIAAMCLGAGLLYAQEQGDLPQNGRAQGGEAQDADAQEGATQNGDAQQAEQESDAQAEQPPGETPEQGIERLTQAIAEDRGNSQLYNERGLLYQELGQYREAIIDHTHALRSAEDDPARVLSLFYRGNAYFADGRTVRAIHDYEAALEIAPGVAPIWLSRGIAYTQLQEFRRALQSFDRAISLDPEDTTAYMLRGYAHSELGNYERALADFNLVLEQEPDSPQALNSRAWFLATCPEARLRDGEQAIIDVRRALELAPNTWEYVDTLAAALAETGDFEGAVREQERALELAEQAEANDEDVEDARARLQLFREGKPYREHGPLPVGDDVIEV